MTTEMRLERLKIVESMLAGDGLTADRRKALEQERAALLADEEVRRAWEANGAAAPPDIDFSSIPPAAGFDSLGDFMAEVERLAALPEFAYQQARKAEAKRLGVLVGFLDGEVAKARPKDGGGGAGQGREITFVDPEPWDAPVDGAAVLDEIAATISTYVALREHDDVKAALWTLHTYCYEASFFTPRLAVTSPKRGCGKSTLFDVLVSLCLRAKTSEGMTAAVIYRLVDTAHPTLLLDEADAWLVEGSDQRAVIDSGHKATGVIHRNVEIAGEWVPREFSSFCPCAIAAIGRLPATIADRSIPVRMRKAMRSEVHRNFRPDMATEVLAPIRERAMRFAVDNAERLRVADPALPAGAFNRFADNWRPLVAIADAAGGAWPARARAAILADLGRVVDDELGHLLLEDIRLIFEEHVDEEAPARQLSSAAIVIALKNLSDRPWNEIGRQREPITQHRLARMLDDFEIRPHGNIKLIDGKTAKGYRRMDFEEAWARYLIPPPVFSDDQTGTPAPARETAASRAAGGERQKKSKPAPRHQNNRPDAGVPVSKNTVKQPQLPQNPKQSAAGAAVPVSHPENREEGYREPATAQVSFMITTAQRAKLREHGYTEEQIRGMRPVDAHSIIAEVDALLGLGIMSAADIAGLTPAERRMLLDA